MSSTSVREEMTLGQISHREKMIRAMRLQIWSGAILGGLAAAVVGAIFLFVVRGSCGMSSWSSRLTLVLPLHA